MFGCMTRANFMPRYFGRQYGLVDDQGRALHLELSRLRKTYKAEWYVKTGGQLETFAQGHSVEVAAEHHADIPALKGVHEETIAAALEDALAATRPAPNPEPAIVPPTE